MTKKIPKLGSCAQFAQDILSFLQSSKQDEVKSYLERGRGYHVLSDQDAVEHWCAAVKARGENVHSVRERAICDDLESELCLRHIEPPYDRVEDAVEKFIAAVDVEVEKLKQDREALVERNDELQRDIDAFKTARDKPKN